MSTEPEVILRAAPGDELDRLPGEVLGLADPLDDPAFWTRPLEPGNSFGHLVLHLTGNLRHYAGARLADSGYVRDREFTEPAPPTKAEALARLREAVAGFGRVVETLPADRFAAPHPDAVMGSVGAALVRMVTHFAVHRGQMSYLARLSRPAG